MGSTVVGSSGASVVGSSGASVVGSSGAAVVGSSGASVVGSAVVGSSPGYVTVIVIFAPVFEAKSKFETSI